MESFRPPPGYALDHAIGTTFSLNLTALLLAPMAFTMFALENEAGEARPDPLALLTAVRAHADRMAIFCQAGQISVPAHDQLLYSHLEDSVFEVTAPRGGVFHPKVWALRFSSDGPPARYRLLVMSRNMTFDRSWDTMLTLEGELKTRKTAIARNHPLGEFFETLPGMTLGRELPDRVGAAIEQTQHELRRVDFEDPEQLEIEAFWPLGLAEDGTNPDPFTGRMKRLLIMSPFVTPGFVKRLIEDSRNDVLISRPEALDGLDGDAREQFGQLKVLDDAVAEGQEADSHGDHDSSVELSGLHAKVYVADDGWRSRLWVGSANATQAAFERNVEFLVELGGMKSESGVSKLLEQSSDPRELVSLGDLLVDYVQSDLPHDTEAERLEQLASQLRVELAELGLVAEVEQRADGTYVVKLVQQQPGRELAQVAELTGWPTTQPEASAARPLDLSQTVVGEFVAVGVTSLTRFFAFKLIVEDGGTRHESRFVLNLPMIGEPSNRREAVLRSLLRNRGDVLRYLLFLLADDEAQATMMLTGLGRGTANNGDGPNFFSQPDLFEMLVKTLDRAPQRLDLISKLVEDLRSQASDGEELLPEGFDEVWGPIWAARQRIGYVSD